MELCMYSVVQREAIEVLAEYPDDVTVKHWLPAIEWRAKKQLTCRLLQTRHSLFPQMSTTYGVLPCPVSTHTWTLFLFSVP